MYSEAQLTFLRKKNHIRVACFSAQRLTSLQQRHHWLKWTLECDRGVGERHSPLGRRISHTWSSHRGNRSRSCGWGWWWRAPCRICPPWPGLCRGCSLSPTTTPEASPALGGGRARGERQWTQRRFSKAQERFNSKGCTWWPRATGTHSIFSLWPWL